MIHVAIAGDGQLGRGVADALSVRADVRLTGPVGSDRLPVALDSGADVVIVATTTRLVDVAPAIRAAVAAGSNVLVSAEECAHPWSVDAGLADELDSLARERGVSILGAGLNPGFVFDALVLTLLGAAGAVSRIEVERRVELGGFGPAVAGRLGLGVTEREFRERLADGRILGHAGFPQSIAVVAAATGRLVDDVEASLEPVVGPDGLTTGIDQHYIARGPDGAEWYSAHFVGRVDLAAHGIPSGDRIRLERVGDGDLDCSLSPGLGSQAGSRALISNSVDRVVAARPGWVTVADLPPAFPAPALVPQGAP